jgi:hypothetical protein
MKTGRDSRTCFQLKHPRDVARVGPGESKVHPPPAVYVEDWQGYVRKREIGAV